MKKLMTALIAATVGLSAVAATAGELRVLSTGGIYSKWEDARAGYKNGNFFSYGEGSRGNLKNGNQVSFYYRDNTNQEQQTVKFKVNHFAYPEIHFEIPKDGVKVVTFYGTRYWTQLTEVDRPDLPEQVNPEGEAINIR